MRQSIQAWRQIYIVDKGSIKACTHSAVFSVSPFKPVIAVFNRKAYLFPVEDTVPACLLCIIDVERKVVVVVVHIIFTTYFSHKADVTCFQHLEVEDHNTLLQVCDIAWACTEIAFIGVYFINDPVTVTFESPAEEVEIPGFKILYRQSDALIES